MARQEPKSVKTASAPYHRDVFGQLGVPSILNSTEFRSKNSWAASFHPHFKPCSLSLSITHARRQSRSCTPSISRGQSIFDTAVAAHTFAVTTGLKSTNQVLFFLNQQNFKVISFWGTFQPASGMCRMRLRYGIFNMIFFTAF